jgi:pyruvate dehydrogenase kinase 2/3/4
MAASREAVLGLMSAAARRAPIAVSLENLFRFGREASRDPAQRLRNAQFLHQELQVRIAQRVLELRALPLDLPRTAPIQSVIGWYSDYFARVAQSRVPSSERDEEEFTELLRFILQDNAAVIETTSRGVLEVRRRRKGFSVEDQKLVDKVLNRFFLARIGLRFLIEHHITSREHREGFAGIIQASCRPLDVVQAAVTRARCASCTTAARRAFASRRSGATASVLATQCASRMCRVTCTM